MQKTPKLVLYRFKDAVKSTFSQAHDIVYDIAKNVKKKGISDKLISNMPYKIKYIRLNQLSRLSNLA